MNPTDFLAKLLIGSAITLALAFLFRKIFPRFTKRSQTDFDDYVLSALAASVIPFGLVVTLILAQDDLGLPNNIERAYDTLLRIIGTIILIRFVNRIGSRFLVGLVRRSGAEDLQQLLQSLFPLLFLLRQQIDLPQIYQPLFQSLYQDFLLHLYLSKTLEKVF